MATQPTFQIEKGIPLPPERGRGGRGKWSPLHAMEIGDSLLVPIEDHHRLRSSACNRRVFPDKTFTVRKVEGGVRVWRIS